MELYKILLILYFITYSLGDQYTKMKSAFLTVLLIVTAFWVISTYAQFMLSICPNDGSNWWTICSIISLIVIFTSGYKLMSIVKL